MAQSAEPTAALIALIRQKPGGQPAVLAAMRALAASRASGAAPQKGPLARGLGEASLRSAAGAHRSLPGQAPALLELGARRVARGAAPRVRRDRATRILLSQKITK